MKETEIVEWKMDGRKAPGFPFVDLALTPT
jgi:hypothetical protein